EYKELRFTPEALEAFADWRTKAKRNPPQFENGLLASHWEKFDYAAASLALIFQVVMDIAARVPSRVVTLYAWEFAEVWVDFLWSHAQRIYGARQGAAFLAARSLLDKLIARRVPLIQGHKINNRAAQKKEWH